MMPNKNDDQDFDNSESQNDDVFSRQPATSGDIPQNAPGGLETEKGTVEGYYSSSDDKYLANEQSGVVYTDEEKENPSLLNSDNVEDGGSQNSDLWNSDEKNSRNSQAFNQDEIILNDNLGLDEDNFRSVSSDDDVEDINTTDG